MLSVCAYASAKCKNVFVWIQYVLHHPMPGKVAVYPQTYWMSFQMPSFHPFIILPFLFVPLFTLSDRAAFHTQTYLRQLLTPVTSRNPPSFSWWSSCWGHGKYLGTFLSSPVIRCVHTHTHWHTPGVRWQACPYILLQRYHDPKCWHLGCAIATFLCVYVCVCVAWVCRTAAPTAAPSLTSLAPVSVVPKVRDILHF